MLLREALPVGMSTLMLGLLCGCAEPPSQQLDIARKSVEAAQAAGADLYAAEEFTKLNQEFAQAKDELANQEQTFSIFRSYVKADELLRRVAEHATVVETEATKGRAAAKHAAYEREKEAVAVVASAKELLEKAPSGKDRAAVEAIKQDLDGLAGKLVTIHDLLEKEDYLGAQAQAKAVKEKGEALRGEIEKAMATVKKPVQPAKSKKA